MFLNRNIELSVKFPILNNLLLVFTLCIKKKPRRVRIIENFIELSQDDFLVFVERSLEENELGKFPAPSNGGNVRNYFLGIRFAVSEHSNLLAEHPAEQPIDFILRKNKVTCLNSSLIENSRCGSSRVVNARCRLLPNPHR